MGLIPFRTELFAVNEVPIIAEPKLRVDAMDDRESNATSVEN
jgi:hypothetical protein